MRTLSLKLSGFLVLAGILGALTTRANDIEPGKEFYSVIYAPKPIVLDGDLSEWSGVPVLADPKFAVPKYSGTNASPNYVLFEEYSGGTWSGPDDQTSAVQIAYDADNVYFGFVVTDDYHENISGNAWNGDSIQLMIADATRTTQVALYNYALGGYEDSQGKFVPDPNLPDPVIVNHEAGPGGDPACNCPTEAVVKRDSVNKKTTYEIKLPKAALGLTTLKGGPQFGLGMAINDGDGATVDSVQYGQAGQEGQKGWGGLGAHSIVFGKTPSETALITLTKGNDIEPAKEYYTALRTTKPIVLDGSLTEWSGTPVLADPKFAVPKYSGTNDSPNYVLFEEYSGGTWTGPDDQTSAVQIVYDADNVYFGFVVTDDYHENISGNAWNGDSIQLMIADATRTTQVALYNYALGGYEDTQGKFVPDANLADPIIVNHEAGPGGDPACNCPTEAIVKRDSVNKKTIYEIKLPVASLGLTGPLTVGTKFGLGMAINDGDGATVDSVQYGQAGQDGQKGWGGLGAHSIVFGKTPSETALVTLGTTVSGSDRLFLSAINPGITSFSFRATDKGASVVDPASAKLTIDGKVVTLTSKKTLDATDFTYTTATPFAPVVAHTYAIEVKDTLGNTVTDQGNFKTTIVKIGLNFGADEPTEADPPGSALVPDDIAGVPAVAQAHWNNLLALTNPTDADGNSVPVPVLSDTGAGTSVTVSWNSNNTWASTGKGEENNKFPDGPDHTLMTGYLDTAAATTSHVTIAGIPEALTAGGGYDVYVYLLGGVAGKGGGYRILDSAGAVLKDYVLADANANPTSYTEVPQNLAAGVHGVGNYIVFKALKAAAITIEATTAAPQGAGNPPRAPINAVQLVPSATIPPALPPGIPVDSSLSAGAPRTTPGDGLIGEYWQRGVNTIKTDGNTVAADRVDAQIASFGAPSGKFTSKVLNYTGNDLSAVPAWLAGDSASFAGTPGNLDDGAFRFSGFINIKAPGTVNIGTTSDDGSRVKIGGVDIIANDGGHGDATVDADVSFAAAGIYPIEITYFNGDWTSDGTGANLNHSGSKDPTLHGGANFHLRIKGANITAAQVGTYLYTAPLPNYVSAGSSVASPRTTAGDGLYGEYWQRGVNTIKTDGNTVAADRVDTQIASFGAPSGTFKAKVLTYLGNDLTAVPAWLAGDSTSFAGTPGNLDDGAFRFSGFLNIKAPGKLNIGTTSDDGSRVKVAGLDIIANDGGHGDATVDADVNFAAAGVYPIEITYFNGDWTSDGTGANLNHSGSTDPTLHGGANFHFRVNGADITTAQVGTYLYTAPLPNYVPARSSAGNPLTLAGDGLKGEYWQRGVNTIKTDGNTVAADRVDAQIASFGAPSGTFNAKVLTYLGNDLTTVATWLAGDSASFAGTAGNLDDGAFRVSGFINVAAPGKLKLGTTSDDGSRVKVGGVDIIANDGGHGDATVDADVNFGAAGVYPIEITYFNGDWTSDGTGANLNHSGSSDPTLHGGANFHFRLNGADITADGVKLLFQTADGKPAGGGNDIEISSVDVVGNSIAISWEGGEGPFLVQGAIELGNPTVWFDLVTTSDRTTIQPYLTPQGFFRIVGKTTKTVKQYRAALNGAAERPNPVTTTTGTAVANVSVDGNTITYLVVYGGLSGPATAGHFHGPADANTAAGVQLGFADLTPKGTSGLFGAAGAALDAATKTSIETGLAYANIHTAANPSGEIRGQVLPAAFKATLNGASERPNPVTTTATGTALLSLVGNQLTYLITFEGLSGPATAGHIHGPAGADAAAGVMIGFPNVPAAAAGTFSGVLTLTDAQLNNVLTGQTYVNLHTAANGGGEIRGQVLP